MSIRDAYSKRHLLLQSFASIIDQFLLSGLNLTAGLVLIRLTTKEEYGIYTQLFAAGLLSTMLLDAFLGDSLTTIASGKNAEDRAAMISASFTVQRYFSIIVSTAFGIGSIIVLYELEEHSVNIFYLGISFGLYIYSLTLREFQRTVYFLESKTVNVLKLDCYFVLYTLSGGCILWASNALTLPMIFLLLSIANLLSDTRVFNRRLKNPNSFSQARSLFLSVWPLSKWAMPGSLVGWAGGYSFLYLGNIYAGLTSAADLNASRLLLVPIGIIGFAWSRVFRPLAGGMISQGHWSQVNRLCIYSAIGMEFVTLAYSGLMLLAFDWLASNVLGQKYLNILTLIELWMIYFLINVVRNISTTMMACLGAYSIMFRIGAGGLLLQWILAPFLIPHFGTAGAIISLIIIEALELIIFWFYLLPRARNDHIRVKQGS